MVLRNRAFVPQAASKRALPTGSAGCVRATACSIGPTLKMNRTACRDTYRTFYCIIHIRRTYTVDFRLCRDQLVSASHMLYVYMYATCFWCRKAYLRANCQISRQTEQTNVHMYTCTDVYCHCYTDRCRLCYGDVSSTLSFWPHSLRLLVSHAMEVANCCACENSSQVGSRLGGSWDFVTIWRPLCSSFLGNIL